MPTTVRLTIPSCGRSIAWPSRCVGCGAAPTTASRLIVTRQVAKAGRQSPLTFTHEIPHCAACARSTKAVFLAAFVPFAIGFLAAGAAGLAFGWYGATVFGLDEMGPTNPRTPNSLVVAGAAGLFAGIAGGFLLELAARVVLLPFFGRSLWRAPLLVPSLFTDSDRVAGLTVQANADMTEFLLTFDQDDIAREFAAANP